MENNNNNARKRQVKEEPEDVDVAVSKKQVPPLVKQEPIENPTPILHSMISSPQRPSETNNFRAPQQCSSTINYMVLFTAFRQFLNGYVQAGGDANLANTLANYAAVLPFPPNPLLPLNLMNNLLSGPAIPKHTEPTIQEPVSHCDVDSNVTDSVPPITTLSDALGEAHKNDESEDSSDTPAPPSPLPVVKTEPTEDGTPVLPIVPRFPLLPLLSVKLPVPEATSEIQRLREAAFGRYKNVLCVICNEWICSRNRKNHIEAHLNYRPYKCSACDYARRREIFVIQHIKTQHKGKEGVQMLSEVDLHVALEVDRLADECVKRTRKLIDSMQEKKDGDFGENKDFEKKALELMKAEKAEDKVVVIESVKDVRPKVANYHRRQRTKVLKKIYDTDTAKQTELKIVKDEDGGMSMSTVRLEDGFEIKLEDLMKLVEASNENKEEYIGTSSGVAESAEATTSQ